MGNWTLTSRMAKAKVKEFIRAANGLFNLQYAEKQECDRFGTMIFVPMFPSKQTCSGPSRIYNAIGEKHGWAVSKTTFAAILADLHDGYERAVFFVPERKGVSEQLAAAL